jgi:hypothetical protein
MNKLAKDCLNEVHKAETGLRGPDDIPACVERARQSLRRGRFEEAIEVLELGTTAFLRAVGEGKDIYFTDFTLINAELAYIREIAPVPR